MKSLTLVILFSCLIAPATAQTDSIYNAFLKKNCKPWVLHLLPKAKKRTAPPYFSNFEVVDFRPDTTRIGFWKFIDRRRELILHNTTSNTFSDYLNTCYSDPAGTRSFLIIIKKLWLYDTIKLPGSGAGRIQFRAEAFLKTNQGLAPYAYLDTLTSSNISVLDIGGFKMGHLIDALIDKIAMTDEATVLQRHRLYSLQQLDSMNRKKYAYPIYSAAFLQAGVYANIDEFMRNQPSILNYEILPDENGLMQLYLKDEQGKSYFSRKMWGYCDGHVCYVMMNGNLFPILFSDHAFYVWGSKEFRRKTTRVPIVLVFPTAYMWGLTAVSETAVRQMSIFNLDVYTGDIY